MAVLLKKSYQNSRNPLAGFPQHPSNRLVDEIMRVMQQHPRNVDGILKIVLSDEVQGRQYGDPAAAGKLILFCADILNGFFMDKQTRFALTNRNDKSLKVIKSVEKETKSKCLTMSACNHS